MSHICPVYLVSGGPSLAIPSRQTAWKQLALGETTTHAKARGNEETRFNALARPSFRLARIGHWPEVAFVRTPCPQVVGIDRRAYRVLQLQVSSISRWAVTFITRCSAWSGLVYRQPRVLCNTTRYAGMTESPSKEKAKSILISTKSEPPRTRYCHAPL